MLSIYIDADGSPVVDDTIAIAYEFDVPVVIVADYAHQFHRDDAQVILVDQGKDSVDFLILQKAQKNDIVITQDYGLAALLLAKQVIVLHHNGFKFTQQNIDELLTQRHTSAKIRKVNKHYGHIKKRTNDDDEAFCALLIATLEERLQ